MHRRHFIKLSATVTATAISLTPWLSGCNSDPKEILSTPQTLGAFCSREELIALGKSYCNTNASERDQPSLEKLLLDDNGKSFTTTDSSSLANFLNQKILDEFKRDDLAIIKGWILSRTEARQIALYSLVS